MPNHNIAGPLGNIRGITFASLNIRSVVRKLDDVKLILNTTKLDLLLLNESWLNHLIGDPELNVAGYTTHRFDRDGGSGKRGGGGLLAFSRNHYSFEHLSEWNICSPDIEIQWLKLKLPRTRPTYIANLYRPPDGDVENCLNLIENKMLDIVADNPGDLVLMGDLNIDLLKPADRKSKLYQNFMKTCGLAQLITTPTRVSQRSPTELNIIINGVHWTMV